MEINFILPLFNEEENIVRLISEIRSYFDSKIIIVDDGSKDSTFDKVPSDENIVKLKNTRNMGKGYAVKKALGYTDEEYVCLIDGDVTGLISEIHRILPILKEYDCVILTPPIKKGGFGVVRRISRYIVKVRTGFDVPWCISGMRVVRTEILKEISEFLDDRFGFEVSMTIELLLGNYNTNNINVDFKHRITTRNFKGFYHRGRQCLEILKYYAVSRK